MTQIWHQSAYTVHLHHQLMIRFKYLGIEKNHTLMEHKILRGELIYTRYDLIKRLTPIDDKDADLVKRSHSRWWHRYDLVKRWHQLMTQIWSCQEMTKISRCHWYDHLNWWYQIWHQLMTQIMTSSIWWHFNWWYQIWSSSRWQLHFMTQIWPHPKMMTKRSRCHLIWSSQEYINMIISIWSLQDDTNTIISTPIWSFQDDDTNTIISRWWHQYNYLKMMTPIWSLQDDIKMLISDDDINTIISTWQHQYDHPKLMTPIRSSQHDTNRFIQR